MTKKKNKKSKTVKQASKSRIIPVVFSFSILGIITLKIVNIWIPLFAIQVLETFLYLFIGISFFAGLLSFLFGGKSTIEGELLL